MDHGRGSFGNSNTEFCDTQRAVTVPQAAVTDNSATLILNRNLCAQVRLRWTADGRWTRLICNEDV